VDNSNEQNGGIPVETNAQVEKTESKESSLELLEKAQAKAEENWNLFLRARADMDNIRRRADIDGENARKYGIERFARALLAVIDSLENGLSLAESSGDMANREGMMLTLKLFLDVFEKFGIHRIQPVPGDLLEPTKHETISMQPTSEFEPNRILQVVQAGFGLHDRVLRPARVIISAIVPEKVV